MDKPREERDKRANQRDEKTNTGKPKGTWSNLPEIASADKQKDGNRKVEGEVSQDQRNLVEEGELKKKLLLFTGEAVALIYRPHNGFANYAYVRFQMKDGQITGIEELSQAYAGFEVIARMEIKIERKYEEMKRHYPEGFQHV